MPSVNLIVSPSAAEVASIRRRLPDRTNPIDPTTHPRGNSFTRSLTHLLSPHCSLGRTKLADECQPNPSRPAVLRIDHDREMRSPGGYHAHMGTTCCSHIN